MDVSNFLNLHSLEDHSDFCLAYVFTYRYSRFGKSIEIESNVSFALQRLHWRHTGAGLGGQCIGCFRWHL